MIQETEECLWFANKLFF